MVLKKRIKVKPRDMDEGFYRFTAAICPICGTNIREKDEENAERCKIIVNPMAQEILYVATRRKITFFCPTCGCSWSVKQFKRDETSE